MVLVVMLVANFQCSDSLTFQQIKLIFLNNIRIMLFISVRYMKIILLEELGLIMKVHTMEISL